MAKEYLVEGAILVCVNGSRPAVLKIPNGHGYTSGGKEKANCGDCIACENIPYFGNCSVNKQNHQCEGYMKLAEKWINKSFFLNRPEKVDGKEAITMDSVLFCKKGGIIMPLTSGQGYEEGINLKEALKRFSKLLLWALGKNFMNCIFGGDPVNMNTGNFVHEREELLIGGKTRLSFRTFYNSMETGSGGDMGEGWHHNFEVCLKKEDSGRLLFVCLGNGRVIPYRAGVGDVFVPVFGDRGKLKKEKEGYLYAVDKGEEYVFRADGLVSMKRDRNGNEDIFVYNSQGKLDRVLGANGGSLSFTYNMEGNLIRVEDNAGRNVHLWYRYGRLWKIVNAMGSTYVYEYNENGKLESEVTPCGITSFKNEYDMADRVVKQILPDGGCMELKYDHEGMKTYRKDANGAIAVYENDERFRNRRTVFADGEEYYEYNDRNQRTLWVDRNGNKTRYYYNGNGELVKVENAAGKCVCMTYDEMGRRTSVYLLNGPKISYIYDGKGNVIEKKDPSGNTIRTVRNDAGQPETVTLQDGSRIHMEYDCRGNMIGITDMHGSRMSFEYDGMNRITSVADRNGNTMRYGYDAKSRVTKIRNAVGDEREFIYDEDGRMTEAVDFDGSRIKMTYWGNGKKRSFEDREGNITLYKYDLNGNLTEEKLPNGGIRQYGYDSRNQLVTYTDELGGITKYEYDMNGNRIKITEPIGNEIRFSYDEINRLVKIEEPDGFTTAFSYNMQNRITEVLYPKGVSEKAEYDESGRKIKKRDIYGHITTCTYNSMGRPEEMKDQRGRKTSCTYYPGGLLKSVAYPDGTGESYTYDGNGNVTEKRKTNGYTIYYAYDELNRLKNVKNSTGEGLEFTYSRSGRISRVMSGDCVIREYTYSPNGNMLSETDAYGCKRTYEYDCMGKIIRMAQEDGQGAERNVTSYERDLGGRIVSVTDSLGNKEFYEYDLAGRMTKKTDRDGFETVYTFHASGKRESIQYGDGRNVYYWYDSLRHLVGVEDNGCKMQIQSDDYGRLESVTDYMGRAVHYEYGEHGEKTSMTYPDGNRIWFHYDALGRLEGITDGQDEISYHYDLSGRLAEKRFPGGIETTYKYCRDGRLEELVHNIQGEITERFSYGYDLAGYRSVIRKERKGMPDESGVFSYGYDKAGRLKTVSRNGVMVREYGYDGFGNRSYLKECRGITEYQYNSMNQLAGKVITGQNGECESYGYKYDRRGNLAEVCRNGERLHRYVFGASNRLEEADNVYGDRAKYLYDAFGNRIAKETIYADGNTVRTDYLTDQTRCCNNLLILETGEKKQRFVWDENTAYMEENGTKSYFLQDEMGSPVRLVWGNGRERETYSYDEFGRSRTGIGQSFGYAGYLPDEIAGTYFAQAREYDAANGRFTGEDPVHGNANWYVYASGNPLKYRDPMGLADMSDADADLAPEWLERALYNIMNGPGLIGTLLRGADVLTRTGWLDDVLDFFGFERTDGDFHVRQDSWQQYFGYNNLYDFAFDAGTNMDFQKLQFKAENGEDYIIWMWKGDYLNLGAGAETGIYKDPVLNGLHWQAAVDDALPMSISVTYKGEEVISYSPEEPQWWITGFDPMVPDVSANDLQVEGSIDFSGDENLWNGFKKAYGKNKKYDLTFDEENKVVTYRW